MSPPRVAPSLAPGEVSQGLGCGACGCTGMELFHVHRAQDDERAGQHGFRGVLRAVCRGCGAWTDIALEPARFVFKFPEASAGCLGVAHNGGHDGKAAT